MILTDSEDESDSDKASKDCEYGTEVYESSTQINDLDDEFFTLTEVKDKKFQETNLLTESQRQRSRSTRVTKNAHDSINNSNELALDSVTLQNSNKFAKMNTLNQGKTQTKIIRKARSNLSEKHSKKRMSRRIASVELLGSSQGMQLILAADKHKKNKHISSKFVQKVAFVPETN